MSVSTIGNNVARVTKKATSKKPPYVLLEQYKAQRQLDNLKIQLDALEREESLIIRPNDKALRAIGEKITECIKKISSITDYLKSIPELYR